MRKRFTLIRNDNENIGMGKGWYIIFEGNDGQPKYDSKFDKVDDELMNRIFYIHDILDYKFDLDYTFTFDFKSIF